MKISEDYINSGWIVTSRIVRSMIENTILLANDIARIGKPDKVKAYEPYFKSAY